MAKSTLRASGIYVIRNVASGRAYVGSAENILVRWQAHLWNLDHGRHHSKTLQRSWAKWGAVFFSWEVIEWSCVELLVEREQIWIDALDAANPARGFNVSPTAGSVRGTTASAETRAKMSGSRKGRPKTEQHKSKISESHRGKKLSPEHKAAYLSARAANGKFPDAISKMWAARSTETKAAISRKAVETRRRNAAEKQSSLGLSDG